MIFERLDEAVLGGLNWRKSARETAPFWLPETLPAAAESQADYVIAMEGAAVWSDGKPAFSCDNTYLAPMEIDLEVKGWQIRRQRNDLFDRVRVDGGPGKQGCFTLWADQLHYPPRQSFAMVMALYQAFYGVAALASVERRISEEWQRNHSTS